MADHFGHDAQEILRCCQVKEPYLISKWLTMAFVLTKEELQELFDEMGPFWMLRVDSVTKDPFIQRQEFIAAYERYLTTFEEEKEYFFAAITASLQTAYRIAVGQEKTIVKLSLPSLMLQPCRIGYSEEKFRSGIFGAKSFSVGLQLSYPQLFEDPRTCALHKVLLEERFINTPLFRKAQKWLRAHTQPLSFYKEGKKHTLTLRVSPAMRDLAALRFH